MWSDPSALLCAVNPHAGSGKCGRVWESYASALSQAGFVVEPALSDAPRDLTEKVRAAVRDGCRNIAAFGGDGTLNEVINGLFYRGILLTDEDDPVTLRILHCGTGGDLARGLEIPKQAAPAIQVAIAGKTTPIDIGLVTCTGDDGSRVTHAFHTCLNLGLSADVVEKADRPTYRRLGSTPTFAAATLESFAGATPITVTLDADGIQSPMSVMEIMVANGPYVGGGMHCAPAAAIDDGLLDVIIVGEASRAKLAAKFAKIYRGTHLDDPLIRFFQTPEGRLATSGPDADRRLPVVVDGELIGHGPVHWRVARSAINVVVQ